MTNPKVSIIISAYKPKEYHFLQALDSALNQSFENIEILVSDDSPTDELEKVVKSRNDKRVKYQHNQPALGPAKNHWHAFSRAKGDYIAILNHDDLLSSEFVEQLLSELDENTDSVLAFCDHWIIDTDGNKLHKQSDEASLLYGRSALSAGICNSFSQLLLSQTIPMAMGSLFRRSSLPKVLPSVGPAYDLWLTFLLARTGGSACYVPNRLSSWRNHEDNTTSGGAVAWLEDSANCWLSIANDHFFRRYRNTALIKSARVYLACSMCQWKCQRRLSSFYYSFRSLCLHWNLRAVFLLFVVLWCPYKLVSGKKLNFAYCFDVQLPPGK